MPDKDETKLREELEHCSIENYGSPLAMGSWLVEQLPRILEALSRPSDDAVVEEVWERLKARCCADPYNAKRCVMVAFDDLKAALKAPGHASELHEGTNP